MAPLALIKGYKPAPAAVRSKMDTIRLTQDLVKTWASPPFQRPLRENPKVLALAEQIKGDGVVPGVITVGILGRQWYLLDGQHRIRAYTISELTEAYADVRICTFDSMAEMGEEFVNLNTAIVRMRPDDVLRGMEGSIPALSFIRKQCEFVGYDNIRRGTSSPILSMATLLNCWSGSESDVPSKSKGAVMARAKTMSMEEAEAVVQFLNVAHGGYGRDPEYWRLWGPLNLTLVAWLWRRTVLTQYSHKTVRLTAAQFVKCLMAQTADSGYVDWLLGRAMSDRDRSPCYSRIKGIFGRRLLADGVKGMFPAPPWSGWVSAGAVTAKKQEKGE